MTLYFSWWPGAGSNRRPSAFQADPHPCSHSRSICLISITDTSGSSFGHYSGRATGSPEATPGGPITGKTTSRVVPSMANRWSHAHRETSSEVVPSTWQPTVASSAPGELLPGSMARGNVHADTLLSGACTNLEGIACIQTVPKTCPDQDRLRPAIPSQSTLCCFRFTLSQLPTDCAKPAGVHRSGCRSLSSQETAKSRWRAKCRRGHHGAQTRGARAADQGTERHARLPGAEPAGPLGRRSC